MTRDKIVDQIRKKSDTCIDEVIQMRRHLHQYPELSFKEVETGKYISEKLTSWGIGHSTGWAENGIVVLLGQKIKGPVVALRADIDALPILERNEVSYRSKNEGVMHACGHDVHTASLLGAIRILKDMEPFIPGTIKCIFQPGEERLPGGASILIKEGVLENPAPKRILGQHVHPPLEVGKVGFKPGQYMASADEIYITINGKGGHGGLPHDCIDPIPIMAQVISALQQMASRASNPLTPTVLTIGKVNTVGGATNIIPNTVKLEGTFRTFDEKWRTEAHRKMKQIVEGICQSMGASCVFEVRNGYPYLQNDPDYTAFCFDEAIRFLGADQVVELPMRTTAEDFAYYSHILPACFYRLGTGNAGKKITSPVHTDTFNIDEDALSVGMGLMAYLAVTSLDGI
jgi:amidohydrolase